MLTKTLHKSHHFGDSIFLQSKSTRQNQRQIASSHLYTNALSHQPPPNIQRSQIFSFEEPSPFLTCSVEVRGQNQDILDGQNVLNHADFTHYLSQMSQLASLQLLSQIFMNMKKWFSIYGKVQFQKCLYLLKNRFHFQPGFQKQNSLHQLIMYLDKREPKDVMFLSQNQKELKFVSQFLIMFKKLIPNHNHENIHSIQDLQQFFSRLQSHNHKSTYTSKIMEYESDLFHKNPSMTASNIHTEINDHFKPFRPKNIQKSMMIIEENSSEYSSPKRFGTISTGFEKQSNLKENMKEETPKFKILHQVEMKNKLDQKFKSSTRNESLMKSRPKERTQTTKVFFGRAATPATLNHTKKVNFHYISPSSPQIMLKNLSTNELTKKNHQFIQFSNQKVPTGCQIIPKENKYFFRAKQFTIPSNHCHQIIQTSKKNDLQSSIGKRNLKDHNSSIQKMKQTATTLNTYQNSSAKYISQNCLNQGMSLRHSTSSDNFEIGNCHFTIRLGSPQKAAKLSPLKKTISSELNHRINTQLNDCEPQLNQSSSQRFYGTIHQLNFASTSIFDVQQVEEMNRSQQKFANNNPMISAELNQIDERNSRSVDFEMNDIQNELDNLFSDSHNSDQEEQIERMIEEFQNLLFD